MNGEFPWQHGPMNKFTSVVTLTLDRLSCTRKCLPGLLATDDVPWELIVVDNGSTDGTVEWLERFRAEAGRRGVRVEIVRNSRNAGCSTGRNQGLERARGERIVFVDNDVALRSRGWLRRLGERLDSRPGVGMVGPKLVYPFPPYDIQFAGGAVSPSGRVKFEGRGEKRDDPRFNVVREVQCFISACFMISRKAFEDTGYFDEAFNPIQYEDIDYSYRLRSRGYKIVYEPAVEMYHFEGVTSTGTPSVSSSRLIIRNGLRFKERWRHVFEREDGPPDAETKWRDVPRKAFSEIGELETVD